MHSQPNVIFVLADQWRQQACGYAGDPNLRTPHLDALAAESVNFTNAVSGCPVCSPYRASLMTGQRPLTHGVFVNDVCLRPRSKCLAEAFADAGYDTAYVGKWHLDGHGRSNFIPPERRLGFAYWKVLECTHDYNHSAYYSGASAEKLHWQGYDAMAQARDAQDYIRSRPAGGKPFLLLLSWGPPHTPYDTAPAEFRDMYDPAKIKLRPNVPAELATAAREWLAGYYAHCSALDQCLGALLRTLLEQGLKDDTIFVFTSDHGDMLGSHGQERKQRPWDEAIRVPFLLRFPGLAGWRPRTTETFIDAPDIMPTLLRLCGIPVPAGVEGRDFSGHISGGAAPEDAAAALLTCIHPFGEWSAGRFGGKAYRGLRTERHTYVRDLDGPWLLYDNQADPYQMRNLVQEPGAAALRAELETQLRKILELQGDEFLPPEVYLEKWDYKVDAKGTIPYTA